MGATRRPLIDSTVVSTKSGDGDAAVHVPHRLLVGTGQNVVTHMLPADGIITIGRGFDASIRVDDPSVSRIHAKLHVRAALHIEDLGSANGTRIGGARLRPNEPALFPSGQVVEIGASWLMIANAPLSRSTTRHQVADLRPPEAAEPSRDKDGLIVRDEAMRNLHRLIERAALSDIGVLLLGETGVGKEIFARRIHALSPRAEHAFLGLNCAALTGSLLESELFGYERGAFTGAAQAKPGLLETAERGTVLLDEVGEMPLNIQAKLLRVLEERQVLRIGSTRPRPIDVRVLSATNRNLEAEVVAGRFRRDLFFRLNSISIEIPPLRDRPTEIEPLARRFVALAAERLGTRPPEIDPNVLEQLRRYQWPGNIRELRNMMERAVVLAESGRITATSLPSDAYVAPGPAGADREPPGPVDGDGEDAERRRILSALEQCAGNQTRAAEVLGISRRTLVSRMAQYNLPRPRKR